MKTLSIGVSLCLVSPAAFAQNIGGINLGSLTDYLFVFTNGSSDANWQSSSKGYIGDVAINGRVADERTSGDFAYSGTIYTNDTTLAAWQDIVDNNPGQATASTGNVARLTGLQNDLTNAFSQINSLSPSLMVSDASKWSGINKQNGIAETTVIDMSGGFQVSSKINIVGDANDVFIFRWDTDTNLSNGYDGQVKFQSGGAFVPGGALTAGNLIHVAGDINASGGGGNPSSPYPQGPRENDGTGNLISGGKDFSGGGFFTGYWLTTGDPDKNFETASLSNAVFVGGWYSSTSKFSMTSGTSGVHVSPIPEPTSSLLVAMGVILCASVRRRR